MTPDDVIFAGFLISAVTAAAALDRVVSLREDRHRLTDQVEAQADQIAALEQQCEAYRCGLDALVEATKPEPPAPAVDADQALIEIELCWRLPVQRPPHETGAEA